MTPSERGSSLIESLVVVVILSTILAMTTSVFSFTTRVFSRETVGVGLQGDVAAAANVVLDDLSIAGYRPEDLLAAGPFAAAPTDSIRVTLGTSDQIDFFGDVDPGQAGTERICYAVVGGRLERSIQPRSGACGTGLVETLAERVTSFDLAFLDSNHAALTTETPIENGLARYVQVTLAVEDEVKGGRVTKRAVGETAIRN